MGAGAILTVQEACELLPVSDSTARRWIRENGLISYLGDKQVVVWAAVQSCLRAGSDPARENEQNLESRRLSTLPRLHLEPL